MVKKTFWLPVFKEKDYYYPATNFIEKDFEVWQKDGVDPIYVGTYPIEIEEEEE